MFYFIKGELALLDPGFAVVDACGVGYKLTISGTTYSALPHITGTEAPKVKLYSHLSVREDSIELYGFATSEECELFKSLISVSGVGPKGAVAILSTLSAERLVLAVTQSDAKAISASPGIGLKTAQKIIIELKDKLSRADLGAAHDADAYADVPGTGMTGEAIDALVVLGYSKNEASRAVAKCKATTVEGIIREALKLLMK